MPNSRLQKKLLNQRTHASHSNQSTSKCLKCSLDSDKKKHTLPNVTELHIEGINIDNLFFNAIVIKYETSDKANIQIINNNIQSLEFKIKGMDIDHFYKHVNSLNTTLASQIMIVPYLFSSYKKFSGIVLSGDNSQKFD